MPIRSRLRSYSLTEIYMVNEIDKIWVVGEKSDFVANDCHFFLFWPPSPVFHYSPCKLLDCSFVNFSLFFFIFEMSHTENCTKSISHNDLRIAFGGEFDFNPSYYVRRCR